MSGAVPDPRPRTGSRRSGPMRHGLVLGGGGVLGAAWMVGALQAWEQHTGLDARDMDQMVGTSAGSILVSLLAAGVGVADLVRHQQDEPVLVGPLEGYDFDYESATGGNRPGRPRYAMGSSTMLRHNAFRLRQLPPATVLAAILPQGTGSLDRVEELVRRVVPTGWAPREGVGVAALDYDTGERVVFGKEGAPPADLAQAVIASCAIPSWFRPVQIQGRRYVDGGVWSSTNVDLMAGQGLDEVLVLAPGVSFTADEPSALATRLERRWRVRVTARCLREAARVHQGGTEVRVLGPGVEDLQVIGGNLMNLARRRAVIATSMRTSGAALANPELLAEQWALRESS